MDAYKNFAYTTVLTAPSPATSGTSLTLPSGQGALFPVAPFNVTVWPTAVVPLANNAEIMRVTAKTGDVLTVTRAQEGTSARTVVVGDQIAATVTEKTLTDLAGAGGGLTQAAADILYANITGDTFTGTLTVPQIEKTPTAPTVVGASYVGTNAMGAPTTRVVTVPTGTIAGDFLLLFSGASDVGLSDVSPANGFTKYTAQSSPHVGNPGSGVSVGGEWWYRIADSSTLGGATITFTSARWLGLITVRGVNGIALSLNGVTALGTSASGLSTTGSRLLLSAYFGAANGGSATNPQPTTGETETPISDQTGTFNIAFSVGRKDLTDGQSIPATGWSETVGSFARGTGAIVLNVGGGAALPIDTGGAGVAFGGAVSVHGTVTGEALVMDEAAGSRMFRIITGGAGVLDFDVVESNFWISVFAGPGLTNKRTVLVARADHDSTQIVGRYESRPTPYGAEVHVIDPVTGVAEFGGKNSLTSIKFCGFKATAGAPTTGTWSTGDLVLNSAGAWHLCSSGGTPGTWVTPAVPLVLGPATSIPGGTPAGTIIVRTVT